MCRRTCCSIKCLTSGHLMCFSKSNDSFFFNHRIPLASIGPPANFYDGFITSMHVSGMWFFFSFWIFCFWGQNKWYPSVGVNQVFQFWCHYVISYRNEPVDRKLLFRFFFCYCSSKWASKEMCGIILERELI